MFEMMLVVGACIAMAKVAEEDNKSGIQWGAITLALCVVSMAIPLPFLRILIASAASFFIMASRN